MTSGPARRLSQRDLVDAGGCLIVARYCDFAAGGAHGQARMFDAETDALQRVAETTSPPD